MDPDRDPIGINKTDPNGSRSGSETLVQTIDHSFFRVVARDDAGVLKCRQAISFNHTSAAARGALIPISLFFLGKSSQFIYIIYIKNLQRKYLVIGSHMLQIQAILLRYLKFNQQVRPLQIFYITFKILDIIVCIFIRPFGFIEKSKNCHIKKLSCQWSFKAPLRLNWFLKIRCSDQ